MIRNYQERVRLMQTPAPKIEYATIAAIAGEKARLRFSDGKTSRKYFKMNTGYSFNVGTKVQISKKSGTYIVEFPVA